MERQNIKIKPGILLSTIVRILIGISILGSFIIKNYFNLFLGLAVLLLTYLPNIIVRICKIEQPSLLKGAIVLFVFSGIYLGNINSFYHKFWWWDAVLHLFSGIILGFIGLLLLHLLYRDRNIKTYMTPFLIAVFMFLFALGFGILWEFYEYTMDNLFNMNMQLKSLSDTMTDLMADAAGALMVSIAGYRYEKNNGNGMLKKIMDDFFMLNSEKFGKDKNSMKPHV